MARKKKGLPFVVQPRLEPIIERVGSEESGMIEIARKGYLTVAEKSIIEQATNDVSESGELIAAVKAIAKAEGMPVADVFEQLQGEAGQDLLVKYSQEVAIAASAGQSQQTKIRVVAATALILCRIDPEWTVEQSMELHPDLLDGLYELYLDEDSRSLAAFNQETSTEGAKK